MKALSISIAAALALVTQSVPATKPTSINLREGTNMAAALSPDGRTLIIDLQGSLWTLPASGGPANRVTDEYLDARQPAWAPDNRRVAFQGYADGVWHIYVMNADGSGLRAVTAGPFDDREPSWSRDGDRIAFSSDRSGNYDVFDLDVAGGEIRQLTNNPANDYAPAYSPVNATIAFVSEREDRRGIWAVDTATATERSIAPAAGAVSAPSWHPDGSRVIYNVIASNRSNLLLDGREITRDEDVFPFRAQWISPTEILYTADGKIKTRGVAGGDAVPAERSGSTPDPLEDLAGGARAVPEDGQRPVGTDLRRLPERLSYLHGLLLSEFALVCDSLHFCARPPQRTLYARHK